MIITLHLSGIGHRRFCGADAAEQAERWAHDARRRIEAPSDDEAEAAAAEKRARVNAGQHRPFELINLEEQTRIVGLIAAGTWPDGWNGNEPHADAWIEVQVFQNGAEQPALFSADDMGEPR